MFPTVKLFNHLVISFYGLFVAVGIFTALLLFYKTAKFRNINSNSLINFGFILIILGIIGSRVFYVIFHWPEFREHSWFNLVAFWRGGLMFQGGFLVALSLSPLLLNLFGLKFWATADVVAPSLALGQGIGRIGCFFAGCCYGTVTSAGNPLSVVFPGNSLAPANVHLWPSQLFESAGLILLFIFLLISLKKNKQTMYYGLISSYYLCGTGVLRFVVDFFRDDDRGVKLFGFPPTSIIAISIFIVGIILLIDFNSRYKNIIKL
ncbi:MAG: prolipoprotein diacylglyceryl transferase [Deltaproteobacteria bacterium]|jgi:phosphatidylglycerol:prolipoprotein diacylglycerol transferase|nr:prolipoprotein diacylglyceryl transferase [Deltaproteobacteria bacterium]